MEIEPVPIKIFEDPESAKKFKKTVLILIYTNTLIEKSKLKWRQ
jgi:hypothetical protein